MLYAIFLASVIFLNGIRLAKFQLSALSKPSYHDWLNLPMHSSIVLVVGDKYQNTGVVALHHITVVSCFGTYPLPRVLGDFFLFNHPRIQPIMAAHNFIQFLCSINE